MKLVSFSESDGPVRPGVLLDEGDRIIDLTTTGYADTLAVLSAGVTSLQNGSAYRAYALDDVRLHAPLANPPRIFCIGLNYRDHAIESGMEIPKFPVVFFKMTPSIVGPGEAIVIPAITKEPDYEAEFAFVIFEEDVAAFGFGQTQGDLQHGEQDFIEYAGGVQLAGGFEKQRQLLEVGGFLRDLNAGDLA